MRVCAKVVLPIVLFSSLVILTGCSSYRIDPAGDFAQPFAIGQCGQTLSANAQAEQKFLHAAQESCTQPSDKAKALEFQTRGVDAISASCREYLLSLYSDDTYWGFSQRQFDIAVVLGTGLMGLNGASTSSFSRAALGAAAVSGSVNNVDNTFLLGPGAEAVLVLVTRGLGVVQDEIEKHPPSQFIQAQSNLRSLADVCTAPKLRGLINDAVKKANVEATTVKSAREDAERKSIREIATLFDVPDLNDSQLLGVYWLTSEALPTGTLKTAVEALIPPLTTEAIKTNLPAIQKILDSQPALRTRLEAEKQKQREANKKKPAEALVPESLQADGESSTILLQVL